MEEFIWWSFWISSISVAMKFLILTVLPYPRTHLYARWEDALSVVLGSAWSIWAWMVLHQ